MTIRYLIRDVRPDGTVIRTWTVSAGYKLHIQPDPLRDPIGPWGRQAVVLEDGKPEQVEWMYRFGPR